MRLLPILGLIVSFLLVKLAGSPEVLKVTVGNPIIAEDWWSTIFDLTAVLGGIAVFFFYWFKFNEWAGDGPSPYGFRPRPARHFTTWLRYLGWNTFYGLFMVAVYSLIVFFPELVYRLVYSFSAAGSGLGVPIPAVTEFVNLLESFVFSNDYGVLNPVEPAQLAPYAVLLTTVVWAGMRPFMEFERRFRLRLQEHAAIPTQARQLVEAFENDEDTFIPEDENIVELLNHLDYLPLTVEDFTDSGTHLWFLYARTEYLNHLLLKYNRSPVFSSLAERYVDEFKDLEVTMSRLREQVAQRIADIQDLRLEEQRQRTAGTPAKDNGSEVQRNSKHTLKASELWLAQFLEKANKSQKRNFQKQKKDLRVTLEAISRDIIQLIVCGVLAIGRSLTRRRDLLKAFGLREGNRITIQLDSITLTWVAGGALFTVFFCSTLYFFAQQSLGNVQSEVIPKDMSMVLWWSFMACLMHMVAIAGGYIFQRSLENNRDYLQIEKPRPLMPRAQVAEAIWSGIIGFSLSVFLLAAFAAAGGVFDTLGHNWWWATVPGVTALFAALYTQKVNRSARQLNLLFWLQGATTGLMATFVFVMLYSDVLLGSPAQQGMSDQASDIKDCMIVFGLYVSITTTVLGLALGKILHMWVTAEQNVGQLNRRRGKRQRFLFKRAKWLTDSGEMLVRAITMSSSGAELKSATPLEAKSEGQLEVAGKRLGRARVLRNDREDSRRCYVQFIEGAA
jgi:hypothetical protein